MTWIAFWQYSPYSAYYVGHKQLLSDLSLAALNEYTSSRSKVINDAVREADGVISRINNTVNRKSAEELRSDLLTLKSDGHLYQGWVYRGQRLRKSDFEEKLKIGKSFRFNSFTSTSRSLDVAMKFTKPNTFPQTEPTIAVLFQIWVIDGISIEHHSIMSWEKEVLLLNDAVFNVISKRGTIWILRNIAIIRLHQVVNHDSIHYSKKTI
eukprot:278004_1